MKLVTKLSFFVVVHFVIAIQPSSPPAKPAPIRPLKWGKLNFLHTTDTHGWHAGHLQESQYSADWGDYLSFTQHMHAQADALGVDLLLVDTGDRIEGTGLADASEPKGKYTREIFKTVPMDVITIGNHELYKEASSVNEYLEMRPHYGDKWVVSNVEIISPDNGNWVPLGNRFRKFKTKNQKINVMAFAFLFNFNRPDFNTRVTKVENAIEEEWFKKAISDEDVDLFLIIGHTPVRESPEFPSVLSAIRAIRPDVTVQFFGGHTHIRDFAVYDDFSTGLESGRYCESVGFLSISHIPSQQISEPPTFFRRYIDFNRFSFQHHTNTSSSDQDFDTESGLEVSHRITKYRSMLKLDTLYGCAPRDYYMSRVPHPHPNSLYTLLADEILPKKVISPMRKDKPALIFINTGSQRFDIFKGPFTYDTSFYVSPFTSTFRYIESVPYSVASRLIDLFNGDKGPWLSTIHPLLSPPQMYFQLKRDHRTTSRVHHISHPQSFILNKPQALEPGYTTSDDAGVDGDDTIHERIQYFPSGNALVANSTVGFDQEPELVDVVFLDFIENYILAGLYYFGVEKNKSSVAPYMEKNYTLTDLILKYAEEEWAHDCI